MSLKSKNFTLKKIIAIAIIGATIFSAIISTIYLLLSNKNIQNVKATTATAAGSITLGSLDGCNTTEMYTIDPNYFCADPNYASTRRLKNSKQVDDSPAVPDGKYAATEQEVTYELNKSGALPQTVAYAKWQNASASVMQNIIWASCNWDDGDILLGHDNTSYNVNSEGIYGRSERFANFINKVLIDGTTLRLTETPTSNNSDDLKIMIDQNNTTYTVGPYIVDFSNSKALTRDGKMTLGDLVYDEIVNEYSGKFIWGDIGANIVNSNGNVTTTSNITILDESGNAISSNFPRFGQEFYVRYTSSDKITKIIPSLQINFVTKISGTANTYSSTECEYRIHDDDTSAYLTAAMSENGYTKKYDALDGLYVSKETLKLGEQNSSDIEGTFQNIQSDTEENIEKYAKESGYEVSSVTLDIGEKGTGYKIGIYKESDNTFYEGDIAIGEQLVRVKTIHRYYLQDADGSAPWWTTDKPADNWPGTILADEEYPVYVSIGQVTDDDGKVLNAAIGEDGNVVQIEGEADEKGNIPKYDSTTAVTEEYCPNNTQGQVGTIVTAPEKSASTLAREWVENANLKYAIKFSEDYPVVTEENKYIQPATTITITPPSTPGTPSIPPITTTPPSTPGTPGTPDTPDTPGNPPITPGVKVGTGSTQVYFPGKYINMYIGGYVWEDLGFTKESVENGRYDNNESRFGGIQVTLHDANTGATYTTTTNSNGQYGFKDLHPMHKYYVEFRYNGQVYQNTYYKNDLSGGYSTAQENSSDRNSLNSRFETIDSTPNNYLADNRQNKSYGMYVRIPASDGTYLSYTPTVYTDGQNTGALRFCDVLEIFRNLNVNSKNIDSSNQDAMENTYNTLSTDRTYASSEGSFKNQLRSIASSQGKSISEDELNSIWNYINHCMISSYTITTGYPEIDRFVLEDVDNPQNGNVIGYEYLYTPSRDQSRNVDFGLNARDTADLAIQKDVYKATVRVNGKTQTYMYNNKDADIDDDGNWNITVRQADYLYNGGTRYTREIRKSEYLYDGTIYSTGSSSARDLKVYVTYRIVVRNQSQSYDTVVNEIVDYFDESEYKFDGTLNGNTYTPNSYSDFEHSQVTSYIGNRDGSYIAPLTVKTTSNLGNGRGNTNIGHGYSSTPLYLSGIVGTDGNSRLAAGGGMTFIYLTFEVRKDHPDSQNGLDENGMDNRIQMDVNVNTGEAKGVGKQNLAEINSYSTYYKAGAKVPDHLDGNTPVDRNVNGAVAGSIDRDSSVGNLTSSDLNNEGDLIITNDVLTNRTEDDTDKAPNIRLIFPASDDYERIARGYVYEDERNQASNRAMVGNGRHDNNETLINGVTVQLVELVQEVDGNGIPTGNYLGEYIWNARTWDQADRRWENVNSSSNSGSLRYYSGQGNYEENHTVSPIMSGAGVTAIEGYTFGEDSTGQYAFKGMPAGDFIVRFIYGDTTQTVLTTEGGEGDEVVQLLKGDTSEVNVNAADGYISKSGLNAKSYNGQDYKSTTYQTRVSQAGSYNGINGFVNYDTQNYNYTESAQPTMGVAGEQISNYVNTEDGREKAINYYYNTGESQAQSGVSDAKDVGNVRTATNNYSRGITGIDGESDQTIVNGRSEVLTSGLKVASTEELAQGATTSVAKQIAMIKELMENTEMVAQTGVINAEVEWNTNITNGQSTNNNQDGRLSYIFEDIDLGLEERPVAQLKMNKEVSNVRITLQNGTILFDTNRPVTNMSYADHEGHHITYSPENPNGSAYRLISVAIANNKTNTPELITTYMDEELMYGARIEVDYTFTVTNVGEVDYLDNQFYYTGVTNNDSANNVSKTSAKTVVDYITNNIQFLPTNSSNSGWSIRTVDDLTSDPTTENTDYTTNPVGNNDDLINNKYYNTLNTYNTIVTSKALNTDLVPEAANLDAASSVQTTMMLSTTLTPDTGEDTMVYNNLSEIVQVSNTQGRRLKWSVTGNQPMADQDRGSDEPARPEDEIYTNADLVTPKEIDADSSQEILILPPTGSDRNYTLWIIVGIVALAIIAGGIVLIRRYFKKK